MQHPGKKKITQNFLYQAENVEPENGGKKYEHSKDLARNGVRLKVYSILTVST